MIKPKTVKTRSNRKRVDRTRARFRRHCESAKTQKKQRADSVTMTHAISRGIWAECKLSLKNETYHLGLLGDTKKAERAGRMNGECCQT